MRSSNCCQNLSETDVTSMYPIKSQVISASYSCSAELKDAKTCGYVVREVSLVILLSVIGG